MKVLVKIFKEDSDSTISKVFLDQSLHHSFYSVEDEERAVKVKGETRVDAGTYPLALRHSPKFSSEYLVNPDGSFEIVRAKIASEYQKTNWKPHELIWIKDTPRHEYCLIHWGNTDDDTDGCLVVGLTWGYLKGQMAVLESRACYEKYYPIIAKEVSKGNSNIEYKRN